MERNAVFRDGVLVVDGRPRLLLAGDYPYYRDRPERWAAKLQRMAELGLQVVTLYVPWRHHRVEDASGEARFVFDDGLGDNRDLVGFLELVRDAGLLALVKPGPFVHGEIQLGGLPDSVSPTVDPSFPALVGADGKVETSQDLALPSALSKPFLAETGTWLGAVSKVLEPFVHPHGPVLAVQLGNEGIYSNSSLPIAADDYSAPSLTLFRTHLARKYRVIDVLDRYYGSAYGSFGEVEPVREWPGADGLVSVLDRGRFSGAYLNTAYAHWSEQVKVDLPRTANLLPPARESWLQESQQGARLDAWLSRVRPEGLPPGTTYGITSWVGFAIDDEETLVCYSIAAKRRRGPNFEENWSLRWNDPRCAYSAVTTYQALFALGLGCTGFNVYPACATDEWGPWISMDRDHLERTLEDASVHDPPYAREAPIGLEGEPAAKFESLGVLTHYLAAAGENLVSCRPRVDVAWGFYAPYSHVAAWNPPADERWRGLRLPQLSTDHLWSFITTALARDSGFELLDIESVAPEDLARYPRIVLGGSFFAAEAVQEKLAAYVEGGGTLAISWESPLYDDLLQHCEILQDRILGHGFTGPETEVEVGELGGRYRVRPLRLPDGAEPLLSSDSGVHGYSVQRGAGRVIYWDAPLDRTTAHVLLEQVGLEAPVRSGDGPSPICLELENPDADTGFLVVLGRHDEGSVFHRVWRGKELEIHLPARGCALVEVSGSRLAGGFVKGLDDRNGHRCSPSVRWGRDEICAAEPCDLAFRRDAGGGFDLRATPASALDGVRFDPTDPSSTDHPRTRATTGTDH